MTQLLTIHPDNPQMRLITKIVDSLRSGGVVVLPTDSGYSLCCQIGEKDAVEQIRRIRELDKHHYFTLFCRDLSEVAQYAKVDNLSFRFIKANTPAPVTFILSATRDVPKRLLHPKRRTIGVRISGNHVMQVIVAELGQALMSVSVDEFKDSWPLLYPYEVFEHYDGRVDIVVDAGEVAVEHSTVVNLINGSPEVIRQGAYKVT